jgi:hypothetical protein
MENRWPGTAEQPLVRLGFAALSGKTSNRRSSTACTTSRIPECDRKFRLTCRGLHKLCHLCTAGIRLTAPPRIGNSLDDRLCRVASQNRSFGQKAEKIKLSQPACSLAPRPRRSCYSKFSISKLVRIASQISYPVQSGSYAVAVIPQLKFLSVLFVSFKVLIDDRALFGI